jgi:nucleoside-diphosphate-sugar epimerase
VLHRQYGGFGAAGRPELRQDLADVIPNRVGAERQPPGDLVVTQALLAGRAANPLFGAPRLGDIRRSYGDISRAAALLGYQPTVSLAAGLRETFAWYRAHERSLPNETFRWQ